MKKYIYSLALLFSIINLGSISGSDQQEKQIKYNTVLIEFKTKEAYNSFLKHSSYNQHIFKITDTEGNEFESYQKAISNSIPNTSINIIVTFFDDLTKKQINNFIALNPDNAKTLKYNNINSEEEEINDPNDPRLDDMLNDPSLFSPPDSNESMGDEDEDEEDNNDE